MEELIRRSDAIAICKRFASAKYRVPYLEQAFDAIPAVEPWDLYDCDEWCRDCKEYDTEKHNCPRWNRVIRRTLEDNQPKQGEWIINDTGDTECSVCGKTENRFIYGTENWYGIGESRFCPNCGTKMKGADDEID
jgi:hypothetical protein